MLAISPVSVLSGINTAAVEAGLALTGAAIAVLPLLILGLLRRKILVGFRGRRTVGKVTGVERTGARAWQARIAFHAADGGEVSVQCTVPQRTRAGDSIGIRYDPVRPQEATIRSAASISLRLLLPLGTLAVAGLVGLFGSLYTSGTGRFDTFFDYYVIVVLALVALFCFFSTYLRYVQISWWRQRAVSAGTVDGFETSEKPGEAGIYACITFTAGDGRKIAFRERLPKLPRAGSKVTVYYDPEIPVQTATIIRRSRAIGGILTPTAIGVALSYIAVVLILGLPAGS